MWCLLTSPRLLTLCPILKCLLLKLKHIGFGGKLRDWISSFLLNCRLRVPIDGVSSEWCSVTSDVQQGSILSPLLFIIYINDIGKDLSSHIGLFADHCTISKEVSSYQDCLSLQEASTVSSDEQMSGS